MAEHPSTTLKVQEAQLAMLEAEVAMHEESLFDGTLATVKQQAYANARSTYLAQHVIPKLRSDIVSAKQYLDWEKRTSSPAPRGT